MDGLNYGTFYFFRTLARDTPALHGVVRVFDVLGGLGVLAAIGLVLLVLLGGQRGYRAAAVAFAAGLAGVLLVEGLNRLIGTPRPPEMDETYAGVDLGPAFASPAAFLSSFVYGLVPLAVAGLLPRRWQRIVVVAVCALMVMAIGFSQLYLRVEHLTGVLAGWALGVFMLLLCWQLTPSLK